MFARGFSLIEMLVVVAIAGIVLAIAVPSFQETMVNGRSRGVAESIQFGLIKARSEAISRNAPMRFQIVSTLDATCTASSTSRLWVVTQYTGLTAPANTRGVPAGRCNIASYVPPDQEEPCPATPAYTVNTSATPPTAASCITDPFIADRSAADRVPDINVTATPTMGTPAGFIVTFGALGQLVANLEGAVPAGTPAYSVLVAPAAGVTGRSYCVQVNSNGTSRLCTQACPCT
jgi:prepilin-type N-terminal cleavage/methylation domain-containing protein